MIRLDGFSRDFFFLSAEGSRFIHAVGTFHALTVTLDDPFAG